MRNKISFLCILGLTLPGAFFCSPAVSQSKSNSNAGEYISDFSKNIISRRVGFFPDDFKLQADGSDDAPSIQRAVSALCQTPGRAGSGGTIQLLARVYEIDTPVKIPCAVSMRGQGWEEQMTLGGGSWLHITSALGTSTPAFSLETGYSRASQFSDFAVTEDHALPSTTSGAKWTPTPYAPVFNLSGVGASVFFHHILWDGVYEGIYAKGAGRIETDGMYSDAFHYLIKIDGSLDVDRFRNIHEWPYWTGSMVLGSTAAAMTAAQKDNVSAWRTAHTNTIILGRADTPFLDEIFSYGTRSAIAFVNTNTGNTGRATKVHIGRLSCDKSASCISIEAEVTNQASMIIDQLDWQGGGALTTSTTPIPKGAAINIFGAAAIQIGNVYAESIGKAVFNFNNEKICSNIKVGTLRASFSSGNGSYLAVMPKCGDRNHHELDVLSYSVSLHKDGSIVEPVNGVGHLMTATMTEQNQKAQ